MRETDVCARVGPVSPRSEADVESVIESFRPAAKRTLSSSTPIDTVIAAVRILVLRFRCWL